MAEKKYIELEAVIEFIRSYRCCTDVAFHMEEHLNEIPAADVRPVVRGKWERASRSLMACSSCGNCVVDDRISGLFFCPNCGADMREES